MAGQHPQMQCHDRGDPVDELRLETRLGCRCNNRFVHAGTLEKPFPLSGIGDRRDE